MRNPLTSLKHAWNLFAKEDDYMRRAPTGSSYMSNPTRTKLSRGNEKTIITSVYNRIGVDSASIDIRHVRLDDQNRYSDDMTSNLNECLTVQANIDQTYRAFVQDVVMSMLDEGCVAIVPVDTTMDPVDNNSYDILSMRTAKIVEWYPKSVKLSLYNDATGRTEEVTLPKSVVAIVENPFYSLMNEPNSTMQRLIRKLSLMDNVDEESSSGSLDLIIQLPYVIKTEAKRVQAQERRKEIEDQLNGSRYGVAYIDGTENVTQLNRSLENNLMKQVEYLTTQLYSQLGITQGVLDGTADESTMNNYFNRTIEPILGAIVDEFNRKFLTKTARTQKQAIQYFRDPFKLIPVGQVSEIADKFTRNEIMSSNEIRQITGMKPSKDPKADELRNKNLSQAAVDIEAKNPNSEKEEDDNEQV